MDASLLPPRLNAGAEVEVVEPVVPDAGVVDGAFAPNSPPPLPPPKRPPADVEAVVPVGAGAAVAP